MKRHFVYDGFIVRVCKTHIKIFRGDNPRSIKDENLVMVHYTKNEFTCTVPRDKDFPDSIPEPPSVPENRQMSTQECRQFIGEVFARDRVIRDFFEREIHSSDAKQFCVELGEYMQLPLLPEPFELLRELVS